MTKAVATCPICEKPATRMVNDHCHATGEQRDRICTLCNVGLGMFKDDSGAMRRAADYLDYWKATIEGDDLLAYVQGRRNNLVRPSDLSRLAEREEPKQTTNAVKTLTDSPTGEPGSGAKVALNADSNAA